MGREDVPHSDKLQHLELIAFVASRNPHLSSALQLQAILESKLSVSILPYEPMLDCIMRLVKLQAAAGGSTRLL